jgi:hypothetical protein
LLLGGIKLIISLRVLLGFTCLEPRSTSTSPKEVALGLLLEVGDDARTMRNGIKRKMEREKGQRRAGSARVLWLGRPGPLFSLLFILISFIGFVLHIRFNLNKCVKVCKLVTIVFGYC